MKRWLALLLIFTLLPVCALAQEPTLDSLFGRWMNDPYRVMIPYENRVFGYAMQLPASLYAMDDDSLADILANMQSQDDPNDLGQVYDIRVWFTADTTRILEFQVKEPTYDGIETEYANREETAQMTLEGFAAQGYTNAACVSGDAFVETPVGDMLESVYTYTDADGTAQVQVVLDLYYGPLEYCFVLSAQGEDVQAARELITKVANTLEIFL